MQEYYEITNAEGNSNFYYVSNPSEQISNAVQDLLMQEYLNSRMVEIYSGQLNLQNYLSSIHANLENKFLIALIDEFMQNTAEPMAKIKRMYALYDLDGEAHVYPVKERRKSWKKDLHYNRSTQIMTGYLLNFYAPLENLVKKTQNNSIIQVLSELHKATEHFHVTMSQMSLQLINHKFIHN